MFGAIDTSTSGMVAQRTRMDVIAGNIANAHTTRDADGRISPYRPRRVMFAAGTPDDTDAPGVHVAGVAVDQAPPRMVHMPGHPDANQDGYVAMPNVDVTTEYVNAIEASRAYEANAAVMDVTKSMLETSIRLIA